MGFIDAITSGPTVRCLDDCDEWCAGLPLERIRILDSVELAELHNDVAFQFKVQRAFSISAAAVFAGLYFLTNIFPCQTTFSLMSAGAALLIVFVVWLLTEPGSWLRRYKSLQSDLAEGIVHCFHSRLCDKCLEVLPRSEVVYTTGDISVKRWRRAPITAVAKTPPISSIASDWLQPVEGAKCRFFSGRRSLSTAEKDEICRWAEQVLDHRRRHAVSYVCWAALLGWLSRWANPELFYAGLAVTGYTGSKILSEFRLFMALRRDAKEGVVVINRRAKFEDGSIKPVGSPAEYLPTAQLKWTENSSPSDWRKS